MDLKKEIAAKQSLVDRRGRASKYTFFSTAFIGVGLFCTGWNWPQVDVNSIDIAAKLILTALAVMAGGAVWTIVAAFRNAKLQSEVLDLMTEDALARVNRPPQDPPQ
jgi:hypothetical protein